MIITLKHEGTCADCGATLPAGTRAKWYRNGTVYGLTCHASTAAPRRGRGGRRPPPPEGSRYQSSYEDGEPIGQTLSRYDRTGLYTADGVRIASRSCGHEDYPCCGC